MELISAPKTEYLLDASLESLHAESREWLYEIDFWNEEMAFFFKLIHLREPHLFFPTADLAALEKEMIKITSENLGVIKAEIQSHERALNALIKNKSIGEEQDYRARHRRLILRMHSAQLAIRKFKKQVYAFIR